MHLYLALIGLLLFIGQIIWKIQPPLFWRNLRLQPLIFPDDISRIRLNQEDAQAGNIFIESGMESKLLDLNTDKSCYIVIGSKKIVKPLQAQLAVTPLTLCGKTMKGKVSDKYLGDYIHTEGPTASVHCTITNRYGRIMSGILETRAIIMIVVLIQSEGCSLD